jgi:hypothetical protein
MGLRRESIPRLVQTLQTGSLDLLLLALPVAACRTHIVVGAVCMFTEGGLRIFSS